MHVSIIGTRGIPNNYGGFEQFAEYLAIGLIKKGHKVTVYNSHTHPYQKSIWNGVSIIHKYDPENSMGTAGQFIYDLNCIMDLKHHNFDIVLQLGYTSNSIWHRLLPTHPKIITNMDGLEWKRTKYSKPIQKFLKYAEKLAAYSSDSLIADSIGIKQYLLDAYNLKSTFIPYGADMFNRPEISILDEFKLTPYSYNMVIARMEPENNIEPIVKAHYELQIDKKLILIGNISNNFSKNLVSNYRSKKIIFWGGVYDLVKLNNLRYFSNIYFHGHSVGGTNPSLLETMASSSLICANDNIFNRSILGDDALYFKDKNQIKDLLSNQLKKENFKALINNNLEKIRITYSWEKVVNQYEKVFIKALKTKA